jgi:hypothetical protein
LPGQAAAEIGLEKDAVGLDVDREAVEVVEVADIDARAGRRCA